MKRERKKGKKTGHRIGFEKLFLIQLANVTTIFIHNQCVWRRLAVYMIQTELTISGWIKAKVLSFQIANIKIETLAFSIKYIYKWP